MLVIIMCHNKNCRCVLDKLQRNDANSIQRSVTLSQLVRLADVKLLAIAHVHLAMGLGMVDFVFPCGLASVGTLISSVLSSNRQPVKLLRGNGVFEHAGITIE